MYGKNVRSSDIHVIASFFLNAQKRSKVNRTVTGLSLFLVPLFMEDCLSWAVSSASLMFCKSKKKTRFFCDVDFWTWLNRGVIGGQRQRQTGHEMSGGM